MAGGWHSNRPPAFLKILLLVSGRQFRTCTMLIRTTALAAAQEDEDDRADVERIQHQQCPGPMQVTIMHATPSDRKLRKEHRKLPQRQAKRHTDKQQHINHSAQNEQNNLSQNKVPVFRTAGTPRKTGITTHAGHERNLHPPYRYRNSRRSSSRNRRSRAARALTQQIRNLLPT